MPWEPYIINEWPLFHNESASNMPVRMNLQNQKTCSLRQTKNSTQEKFRLQHMSRNLPPSFSPYSGMEASSEVLSYTYNYLFLYYKFIHIYFFRCFCSLVFSINEYFIDYISGLEYLVYYFFFSLMFRLCLWPASSEDWLMYCCL